MSRSLHVVALLEITLPRNVKCSTASRVIPLTLVNLWRGICLSEGCSYSFLVFLKLMVSPNALAALEKWLTMCCTKASACVTREPYADRSSMMSSSSVLACVIRGGNAEADVDANQQVFLCLLHHRAEYRKQRRCKDTALLHTIRRWTH